MDEALTAFTPPPPGMLSEQIDCPDHRLSLGLMHREGEGIRIFTWDGNLWRHLTTEAAIKYAQFLEGEACAEILKPVADALRTLADRVNEIETATMFERAGRAAGASMRAPAGVIDLGAVAIVGRA